MAKRLSRPIKSFTTTQTLEKGDSVLLDLCRSKRVESKRAKRYMVLIKHDYSR